MPGSEHSAQISSCSGDQRLKSSQVQRERGGVVSREQERWIRALAQEGYCAAVCRGWEAAAKLILRYLAGEIGPDAYGEERAGERG